MCSSSDHFYTDGQLFYPVTGLQMKRTSVTRTAHHRYKYCIGVVFYSTVQYSNRQGGCSRQFFPFISVRICLHSDGGGFVVLFFALYIRIFGIYSTFSLILKGFNIGQENSSYFMKMSQTSIGVSQIQ